MSQLDAAFTNRPMAARRGNLPVSTTPDRLDQCASIQRIRTSCGCRPSVMRSNRTPIEVCSKQRTAANPGARFSSSPKASVSMDVELQPGNPSVVYAWMSRLERKPWTIISGSREGGFYKSTDGGDSFTRIPSRVACRFDREGQSRRNARQRKSHLCVDRSEAGRRTLPFG